MPIPSTTNNKEASNKSLCLSVGAGNALYQGEFLSFFYQHRGNSQVEHEVGNFTMTAKTPSL